MLNLLKNVLTSLKALGEGIAEFIESLKNLLK